MFSDAATKAALGVMISNLIVTANGVTNAEKKTALLSQLNAMGAYVDSFQEDPRVDHLMRTVDSLYNLSVGQIPKVN